MLEFAQSADGPGFLDALTHALALSVARVTAGAAVNGRTLPGRASIISSADSPSARPLACVVRVSTISPWRLSITCEFVRHPWAELIPGLRAGRFDAVAASMSITAERRQLVGFTNRYYSNTSRFVSHEAARFDPEKPAGRAVGAMRGTIASDWLKKNMPEALLLFYRSPDDLLRDLGANKLDAAFGDELGAYA